MTDERRRAAEDRPADAGDAGLDDSGIPDDPRVVQVVQDFLEAWELGLNPDRRVYIERYPELADAVAHCLEGLEFLQGEIHASRSRQLSQAWTDPTATAERVPRTLGDFQIIRPLGRGGMGIVYEAMQLSLARPVALKVLPFTSTFDEQQLKRFKIEAQAAALLHHTHIVPIYAVGCERGVHFYAMQLINGQSLAAVIEQLRRRGRDHGDARRAAPPDASAGSVTGPAAEPASAPSLGTEAEELERATVSVSTALTAGISLSSQAYFRRVARLMVQAADALEHAHQQGVIHRDIKPGNLLVNAAGNLWVTDFGLAQLHSENGLTRSGDVLGTARYMSPEQISGRRTMIDHRTDVYSLAATFYELLTWVSVFSGETRQELLLQILRDDPRPPRVICPTVPVELETIVLKALSKNPDERYPTAAALGADIQRYLDHQPIQARRPSLVDRTRKWARRHPAWVAASMLTLAIVSVVSLVSMALVAHQQRLTTEALARERVRAQEADQQFRKARQAVDVLFQVSEEELADKPMVEGTRKRLLEIVLSYYQDFIEQQRGDAISQADLETVQDRVKGILHELNVLQRESYVHLLGNQAVQRDLGLVTQQVTPLHDLLIDWAYERGEVLQQLRGQTEEARRRRLARMAEEHERTLATILTEPQRARLAQIALQCQGLFAFKDPDVIQTLQLTAAQRAAIRTIEEQTLWPGFGWPGPGPGPGPMGPLPLGRGPGAPGLRPPPPPAGHLTSPPNASAVIMQQVLAVLTPQQVQAWQQMIGPPFEGAGPELFFGSPPRPPGEPGRRH